MWVNCVQTRFLHFFLLSTSNFETALNSVIHKTDLVLNFDGDGCAPPWISSGSSDSCYLKGNNTMTWDEGWDFCDHNGGYLLEVDTEQEHLDLLGRLNKIRI